MSQQHNRKRTRDRSSRFARLFQLALAAVFVVAGAVLPTSSATAAPVTLVPGDNVTIGHQSRAFGYGGTALFPIYAAETNPNNPGNPLLWAYCIEHDVHAGWGRPGTVEDVSHFLGRNNFSNPAVQKLVYWVLAHSYPALSLEEFGAAIGIPGISRNDAIEATQYAIWRYTDGATNILWSFTTANSRAAYRYLVNGADASGGLELREARPTVSITGPTNPQSADSLIGPFVVSTNQHKASVSTNSGLRIVDAAGNPVDKNAVVNGQELYLDTRGKKSAGSASISAHASGSASTGNIINVVPGVNGQSHAQTIILVTPHTTKVDASADVAWPAAPVPAQPSIRTTLVDDADGDHTITPEGGSVTDTVAYQDLTPGKKYSVHGELHDKATGKATGIVGQRTFTPTEATGTVEVSFTIPDGFAGEDLVAFEVVTDGGVTVASHEDINDAAQTVTVTKTSARTAPPSSSAPSSSAPSSSAPSSSAPSSSAPSSSAPTPAAPSSSEAAPAAPTPDKPIAPANSTAGAVKAAGKLADTGADVAPLGVAALLLVGSGGLMLLLTHRRKSAS